MQRDKQGWLDFEPGRMEWLNLPEWQSLLRLGVCDEQSGSGHYGVVVAGRRYLHAGSPVPFDSRALESPPWATHVAWVTKHNYQSTT